MSAGVYRTLDGGRSWQRVTDSQSPAMSYGWATMWGPSVMGLAIDPRAPDTLYFSTSGHLFRTTDRGDHWTAAYTRRVERQYARVALRLVERHRPECHLLN